MKNAIAIASKDLRSQFVSPIAYVVTAGFLLLGGWFFFNLLSRFSFLVQLYMRSPEVASRLNLNELVIAPLLHNLSVVLVILVPVITMRAFAEEKRTGTFELLMTSPVSVGEIVLGKFLGAFVFVFLMLALTAVYPAILLAYGDPPPEAAVLLGGFFGLLLLATAFVSVGLLMSSLTQNQIIAAVSCLVVLLLLYVISWPADTTGGTLGEVLRYLSLTEHFQQMVKGVIDTRDVTYFLSLIVTALFLTQRAVESVRWR